MTQNRRTFLQNAGIFGGIAATGALTGCVSDVTDFGPDDDGPSTSVQTLESGFEIGMVFTAFGGQTSRSDVDPDEPGGGRLITVESVDPGEEVTVDWRQTVERERTPTKTTDVGVGTTTATPEVEVVEETGTVTASGIATAHEPYLPMYWRPGEVSTDTSGIWLSREAYTELAETQQTTWSEDVLTRISWAGRDAADRIHDGVADVEEVVLRARPEFDEFAVTVDSREATVETIVAHDTFGNEYVVAAAERNPLILKFTYDAVSTGFTGFDTGLWTLIKAVFSGYQVVSLRSPRA